MAVSEDKPTLAYWSIRGLAQPVRMILCHCGVDFEDKQYNCLKTETGFDSSCWYDVKHTLGMQYPNLPYFFDGETKISQTNAILTYVAEKYGLHDGFSVEQKGLALMHLNQMMDVRNRAVGFFYGGDHSPEGTEKYKTGMKKMMNVCKNVLEASGQFLLGEKVCAADFHLAELIYQHRLLDNTMFAEMTELVAYQERIFNLENVSKACQGLPANNKMAKWGAEYVSLE